MADTPPASSDGIAPEKAKTPTAARVAVVVMWVLAALLLLQAALEVVLLESLIDQATTELGVSRDDALRSYLLSLVPNAVFGLIIGLSAWGLARRHPWARWTGLGAGLMLFALALLSFLTGVVNVIVLLVLLLSMVVSGSLLSRTTAQWIPRLHSKS